MTRTTRGSILSLSFSLNVGILKIYVLNFITLSLSHLGTYCTSTIENQNSS